MNDVISQLQQVDPVHRGVIDAFLEKLSLSRQRSHMPGLLLNGKQIEKIIKEENLQMLHDMLVEVDSDFLLAVDYLRSLRSLHRLMVSKTLDKEYPKIIGDFRVLFDQLYDLGLINETPKCHLLYSHLEEWFRETEETLWFADTSGKNTTLFTEKVDLIDFIYRH